MQRARWTTLVAAAAATGLAGARVHAVEGYEVGDVFPGFTSNDLNGQVVQFSDFAGSYVLLDFCAIWCAPCQSMAPDAGLAEEALNDGGIPFVYAQALIEDQSSSPADQADAQVWAGGLSVDPDVRVLHASGQPTDDIIVAFGNFGLNGMPTLAYVGPDGVIFQIDLGYRTPEQVVQTVAAHAGVPAPPLPPPPPAAPPWPALSAPAPVADATFSFAIGAGNGSSPVGSIDGKTGALLFDLSGGSLPLVSPQASILGTIDAPTGAESWIVSLFDLGMPASPIPHDQPLLFEFPATTWIDGCVAASAGSATFDAFDPTFTPVAVPDPFVAVTVNAGVIRIGPFTLEDAGLAGGTDVIALQLTTGAIIDHSAALSVDPLAGEVDVAAGSGIQFQAVASGGEGPPSHQWQLNGVDLVEGGAFAGVATATMTIDPVSSAEDGYYGLRVTDGCRTVHSGYKRLDVGAAPPGCPADCGAPANDHVDVVDLLALLAQWGGPGSCEIAGGGMVDVADLLDLLGTWGPCPAPDDDGDGVPNAAEDLDGDGDPTNDDTDADGTPDYLDPDDDNDSVATIDEDPDGDGDPTGDDTDGDGLPDYLDDDDDDDGVLTIDEDPNGNGDPTDDDTDGDGIPDYLDDFFGVPDDDGDGVPNAVEDLDGDGDPNNDDTDADGTPDYLDPDDDGDSVATLDEDPDGDGDPTNDDTDSDGTPNYLDDDDDDDGVLTIDEDPNGNGDPTDDDSDGDGTPDYLDAT